VDPGDEGQHAQCPRPRPRPKFITERHVVDAAAHLMKKNSILSGLLGNLFAQFKPAKKAGFDKNCYL